MSFMGQTRRAAPIDPEIYAETRHRISASARAGACLGNIRSCRSAALCLVMKQNSIPCQGLPKRKKTELIEVIATYAANTDIGSTARL